MRTLVTGLYNPTGLTLKLSLYSHPCLSFRIHVPRLSRYAIFFHGENVQVCQEAQGSNIQHGFYPQSDSTHLRSSILIHDSPNYRKPQYAIKIKFRVQGLCSCLKVPNVVNLRQ